MRLLITADLHYNHVRSRPVADEVIERMNRVGGDAVLVVGDTATAEGDWFERCLERFTIDGPKLLVAGNHELWTRDGDSREILFEQLPRRAREIGWWWLEDRPFVGEGFAIVGSVGWYDYQFAQASLGIPRRFYAAKVSPGATGHFTQYAHLMEDAADVPAKAMEVVARWNDGKFVHLHELDEAFLEGRIESLRGQLEGLKQVEHVVAAIHHLPFEQLLPPAHSAQWDFAKAYLGSPKIGELLMKYENVRHCFCGHSHFPVCAQVGRIRAINIGSGYRQKYFDVLEV